MRQFNLQVSLPFFDPPPSYVVGEVVIKGVGPYITLYIISNCLYIGDDVALYENDMKRTKHEVSCKSLR